MKKIFAAFLALWMAFSLSACNYQVIDVKYNFNYAIISLPNGEQIEGHVDSWRDYENSDQIQVTIDGCTYLIHSTNVVLMTEDR